LGVSSYIFAFTYLGLALYLFINNWKSPVHRTAAYFLLCLGVWSLGDIFVYASRLFESIDKIHFANISALGCLSFPSFFLLFTLAFTGKKTLMRMSKAVSSMLLFMFPLVFIYKQWESVILSGFISPGMNTANLWSDTIWQYSFYIYYLSFMGQSLYLLLDYIEKTSDANSKKQAKIIAISTIFAILSVSFLNILIPEWHMSQVTKASDIVILSMLVWAFGIFAALRRHNPAGITPSSCWNG